MDPPEQAMTQVWREMYEEAKQYHDPDGYELLDVKNLYPAQMDCFGNPLGSHTYHHIGTSYRQNLLPSKFKILLIWPDMKVVTSEIVALRPFGSYLTFDAETGNIRARYPFNMFLYSALCLLVSFSMGLVWCRAFCVSIRKRKLLILELISIACLTAARLALWSKTALCWLYILLFLAGGRAFFLWDVNSKHYKRIACWIIIDVTSLLFGLVAQMIFWVAV